MSKPNRIFFAIPMYGPVYPTFYQRYMGFVGELQRANPGRPVQILTVNMAHIEHVMTKIVQEALDHKRQEVVKVYRQLKEAEPNATDAALIARAEEQVGDSADWDYLVVLEHDNIPPHDWAAVVANELDPDIHKVVGRWYFGKEPGDQRSICGYIRPDGAHDRLSYDEVQYFRQNPGLYRVGTGMPGVDDSSLTFTVGMGCTAFHRSVFENWSGPMPWFQSVSTWKPAPEGLPYKGSIGYLGHDVNFCIEAAKQGIPIWVDTRAASGHVGEWISDDVTFTATAQHAIREGKVDPAALSGAPNLEPYAGANPGDGVLTAMTNDELASLARLAQGKTVLEIGARLGASTFTMARGAQIVYSVDWHRGDVWHGEPGGTGDSLSVFWRFAQKYGLRDKVVPLVGTSRQVLPRLEGKAFDLILVDGDHSYEGATYDLYQARRLIKPGGAIVVHDFNREQQFDYPDDSPLKIGVTRAAREVLGEPDELLETIGIYRTPAKIAA